MPFPVLAVGRYVCVHIHDHVSFGVLKTLNSGFCQ